MNSNGLDCEACFVQFKGIKG